MSTQLPQKFRDFIEKQYVERFHSSAELKLSASNVSSRYRRLEGELGDQLQIKSESEGLAYLATRLPATYAVNSRVLELISEQIPDFSPKSFLDLGAGPGTSSLAGIAKFETLDTLHLVEPNIYLRTCGEKLFAVAGFQPVWFAESCASHLPNQKYDMVCASYVFNELSEAEIRKVFFKYWEMCSGVFLVVETGTPVGAGVVRIIRDEVLKLGSGAYILGPCPHDKTCPLDGVSRWCHFATRVERSKLHLSLKEGGSLGYEDEKFSWLAVSRFPAQRPHNRIIGHPAMGKVREIQVCTADGKADTLKLSRSHADYKRSKKWEWGDGV